MSIKLDRSTSQTVVIVCTECPYWSAFRYGMLNAHDCAAHHELTMHPEQENARRARRDYRSRHAADSPKLPAHSASFQA